MSKSNFYVWETIRQKSQDATRNISYSIAAVTGDKNG